LKVFKNPQKIYGVLGYPAKHSLSPAMHNAAFEHLKINAQYKIFEKPPQELKGFLESLSDENICGLNVTIPYKEKVIPYLHKISDEAALIGAVNTITTEGNRLQGLNTDAEGFLKQLNQDLHFTDFKGKVIAIIGAGGAARAISVILSKENPAGINIYDIDNLKSTALVGHLIKHFPGVNFDIARCTEELIRGNCRLLINASGAGMKPKDPLPIEEKFLSKDLIVLDVIYNPPQTKLLKIARQKGCRTANGLGMLLYQGALSFQAWTNQSAPVEVMRQALNQALDNAINAVL
jgi:shikimate dehydrogenase